MLKYYSSEMFSPDNLKITHKKLYDEKEALEYKIKVYSDKFYEFKRVNFPDLFLFEIKKQTSPGFIPDKVILAQYKILEMEASVIQVKQTISKLKQRLQTIDNDLETEASKLQNTFTFKDEKMYALVNLLNRYYAGTTSFIGLMTDIFDSEFGDWRIFFSVAGYRSLDVVYLLVQRAPTKWKKMMLSIYQEVADMFTLEEIELCDQYETSVFGVDEGIGLATLILSKYNKLAKQHAIRQG